MEPTPAPTPENKDQPSVSDSANTGIPQTPVDTPAAPVVTAVVSQIEPVEQNASAAPKDGEVYLSNPFLNAAQGLVKVLTTNAVSSMLSSLSLLVLFAIYYVFILVIVRHHTSTTALEYSFVFLLLSYLIIVPFTAGLVACIGAASVSDKTISFKEVFMQSIKKWPQLFVATLLLLIITVLGFILLIVPGVILVSRLSLTFLIMFEENLGPIKGLKRSFAMTKGHTFEMIGSFLASSWLTGGYLLTTAFGAAPLVGRYKEIKPLESPMAEKPKTHWMNYALLTVNVLVILGGGAYIYFAGRNSKNQPIYQSTQINTSKGSSATIDETLGIDTANTAIGNGLSVGNAYIADLESGNYQAAYSLEVTGAKGLQANDSVQNVEAAYKSWNVAGDSKVLTNIAYVKGFSGEPAVSMVWTYSVPSPTNYFYVRLVAEYNAPNGGNGWQIALVQGSLTKIFP